MKMRQKLKTAHQNFKVILVIAQCFGIMPVCGVMKKNAWFLKFSWKSKRTLYSIAILLSMFFATIISTLYFVFSKLYLWKWNHFSFYACNFLNNFSFLYLAPKWPKLMVNWSKVEYSTKFMFQKETTRKFLLITSFILGTGIVEHVLAEVNSARKIMHKKNYMKSLTENDNPGLTYFLPYTVLLGIFSKIINLLSTFSWSYNDLFIMLVSVALADMFKQVSTKISSTPHSKMTEKFWKEIREDYCQLCELYENMEAALSFITLMSFASNLFFILMQLYFSIRGGGLAFFFSFGMLLLRTLCVCLYGSAVYEESKKPLQLLVFLPSHVYCEEVERLIDQINIRTIALTGYKLFNVTRGLIFRIAATVVTYELFLFQFNVNSASN